MRDDRPALADRIAAIGDPMALLAGLFEFAPVAFQVWRPDGSSLFVNPAFLALFGSEPPPDYRIHRDEIARRAGVAELFERAFAGETVHVPPLWYDPRELEHVEVREGRRVAIETFAFPLRDLSGAVANVVFAFKDVTEIMAANDRLRASEARFATLFEHASDIIALIDGDGRIDYISPAVTAILGYEPAELVGRPIFSVAHPDEMGITAADFERILSEPGVREAVERRARHRDGRWVWVEAVTVNLLAEPAVGRIVVTVRDLTFRRALEEQLNAAQKMEAIGRLAGGIAHDFNNLLTAIRGFGGVIHDDLPDGSPMREDAAQILRAADRAAALTQQLLALSRRQMRSPVVLDAGDLLDELGPMLRRIIGEDVELVVDRGPGELRVRADTSQLHQVILNLAVNARDAMPEGGSLTLAAESADGPVGRLDAVVPGPWIVLTVRDTGTGIDEATRAHLFEPFFTTKTDGRGTGLGLAIVDGIVRQSDGVVTVESGSGAGTTFRVYLPRTDEPISDDDATVGTTRRLDGWTVLLVEDDAAVRDLTRRLLQQQGLTVLTAVDGATAIELAAAQAGPIDLLVTDVVMPGIGGPELARTLLAARPALRVVLMSGYAEAAVFERGVVGVPHSFLGKPFTSEQLATTLRQALDRPRPEPRSGS